MTEIRFITDDEIPAFHRAIPFGFGSDLTEEDDADDRFREVFPLETCIGAFDDDRVVATFGSFDFDLTVPGGTLPMAGTTIVTVQPTHRRQGLLTKMMGMHLEQAIERDQPLAGLWASETAIYGRFGYGQAANAVDLTVPTDRVALPEGPSTDTVRLIDAEEALTSCRRSTTPSDAESPACCPGAPRGGSIVAFVMLSTCGRGQVLAALLSPVGAIVQSVTSPTARRRNGKGCFRTAPSR